MLSGFLTLIGWAVFITVALLLAAYAFSDHSDDEDDEG